MLAEKHDIVQRQEYVDIFKINKIIIKNIYNKIHSLYPYKRIHRR